MRQVGGIDADPDRDGLSNRLEVALALDPLGGHFDRLAQQRVLGADDELVASFVDFRRVAAPVDDALGPHPVVELFKALAKGPHVHVEYGDFGTLDPVVG